MKQVVQPIGGGPVQVLDVPRPGAGATEVLVRTLASVISPGTERAVTSLAQSSLLGKARARPDLVRQVIRKARNDGLAATAQTVRARLATDLPLGYSAAGIAVEVGDAVSTVRPGDLVATGGAGHANHAEWQAVPGLLCTPVPEGVTPEAAAFTTIASVALHGLRLADVGAGARVVVIGLGLVGQLTARLAVAAGCEVAGIDVAADPLRVAVSSGVLALEEQGAATTEAILGWSRGRGADAVLLCAADASSAALRRTPDICRDGARVVVVGDVGIDVERTPFYEKELALLFARSYGPGRYERGYEEYGVDYPPGHVRWTEGRNFEAVLDLLAGGRIRVDDLVTHRYPIADAASAYELVASRREPYLAIALSYPAEQPEREPPIELTPRRTTSGAGVGWIGAGAYSTSVLLPAFVEAGFDRLVAIASASGLTAVRAAERHGFARAVSSADEVIGDKDVEVVVVATPHDTHARYVVQALQAGKHVWCEKPLALSMDELDGIEEAWRASGSQLFVGHNRRWSPFVQTVQRELAGAHGAVLTYRVSAGRLPTDHWYADRRQGGRLIGEVSHFIDTCAVVAGSPVEVVHAIASDRGELLLADDLTVSMRHGNGSLSVISYASAGHPGTAKERLEVLGAGHTWVIDDFRRLTKDGKQVPPSGKQDKGQRAAPAAFRQALAGGEVATQQLLDSTRATLAAAAALSR